MRQMFQKMAIQRSFRTSLIVLFLSELTAMAGPLIDGILIAAFLGALGVQAFGVVNPLLVAYNAIGSVFAVGSVSLCTRLLGKGKTDEAKGAFTVSFLWVLGLSMAVTIVLLCISDPMIHLLSTANASKELFAEARNYYIGITVSFPAINLMIHMTSYMQVDNDRRRALISTMVLTGVDIAGDLLSATVLDGGMLGMGLSTSIANYAALLVLLLHFHKKDALFKPVLHDFPWHHTGAMVSTGIPACTSLAGTTIMFIVLNRLLIHQAGEGIALVAFTAQRTVDRVLAAAFKSLGRATTTMSGFFHGELNKDDMDRLFRLNIKYSVLLAGGLSVLVIVLSGVLAVVLAGHQEAVPEAARAIRILGLCLPFASFNVGYECFFRGAGRLKVALPLTIVKDCLLPILAGYILTWLFEYHGVYWAYTAAQILMTAAIVLAIVLRCRKKDKSFIEMALFLPDYYTIPEEDYLYLTVEDLPGCVSASHSIMQLCTDHRIDRRHCIASSLCVEEMCKNILQHGSSDPDKDTTRKQPSVKKNAISVRCLIDQDQTIRISIRDDCRPFSPVEWKDIHQTDEDPTANIGIRLTSGLSQEMRYVNVMNMNSLYITI